MSPLVLALLIAAQAPDAPLRTTLSNDRPEFPVGFAKDRQLLEDANQAAIRSPIRVGGLMEEAAKKGDLLPIPSGTKAKLVATEKLRGPMFKEIAQVEITEGSMKGLRGWIVSKSLVTDQEFAAIGASSKAPKAAEQAYQPLYRDPAPGETAYLAPQPTMFGMVRSLTRLYGADDSAPAVFKEWQEATDATRDAVLKRLESNKAIFYTPLNTEARVQKVFSDKMTRGVYPVEVEVLSGPLKGTVAWVCVENVSSVAATRPKVDPSAVEKRKTDLQTTIEHRKNRRMKAAARAVASAPPTAMAPQPNQDQMRTQMQLQMLQQQAAACRGSARQSVPALSTNGPDPPATAAFAVLSQWRRRGLWPQWRDDHGRVFA